MIKKTIGTILTLVAVALIVFLLTYGGPVFPHVLGPSLLAVIGVVLLLAKGKANKSAG